MNVVTRNALLNELYKIASESKRPPHWSAEVAKGILGMGIGAGLGTGAAHLLEKALPKVFTEKHPALTPAMKIVLPIIGATTFHVEQRLKRRLEDTYRKAPGYLEEKK